MRAAEDVGSDLLRLQQRMDAVRQPDSGQRWRAERVPQHGGQRTGAVEVRDKVEVRVTVVQVEGVAGHIQPEDREVQIVGPDRIALPSPPVAAQVEEREEQAQAADDYQVAYGDRFAGVAWVLRVPQHVHQKGGDTGAQQRVEREPSQPALHRQDPSRRRLGRSALVMHVFSLSWPSARCVSSADTAFSCAAHSKRQTTLDMLHSACQRESRFPLRRVGVRLRVLFGQAGRYLAAALPVRYSMLMRLQRQRLRKHNTPKRTAD